MPLCSATMHGGAWEILTGAVDETRVFFVPGSASNAPSTPLYLQAPGILYGKGHS